MKNIPTIAFLGAAAIAVGVISVNAFSDVSFDSAVPTVGNSGLGIMGHATIIVHDSEGNIKAYRQTDNAIITVGKDCAARFLFHNDTADQDIACNDSELTAGFDGFRHIAVDNTTGVSGSLDSSASLSDFGSEITSLRATSTPDFTAASGTSGTSVSLSTGSQTITDTVGSTNVTRSALMDDATSGSDVAAAIINIPNGVSVNTGDSLTVSWTVTVG